MAAHRWAAASIPWETSSEEMSESLQKSRHSQVAAELRSGPPGLMLQVSEGKWESPLGLIHTNQ